MLLLSLSRGAHLQVPGQSRIRRMGGHYVEARMPFLKLFIATAVSSSKAVASAPVAAQLL
jgi:hypothetical protein